MVWIGQMPVVVMGQMIKWGRYLPKSGDTACMRLKSISNQFHGMPINGNIYQRTALSGSLFLHHSQLEKHSSD